MEIEFDPAKDKANRAKHRVSLERASQFNWDSAMVKPDTRRDYGEDREIGYGLIGVRLYCIVFVRRPDDGVRVISLRKANKSEVAAYEKI